MCIRDSNYAVRYTPARVLLLSTPSWQLPGTNHHIDGWWQAAIISQDRVLSSVGRAAPLQGVGHRFDPCSTHQKPTQAVRIPHGSFLAARKTSTKTRTKTRTRHRGGFFVFRPACSVRAGLGDPPFSGAPAFFVNVLCIRNGCTPWGATLAQTK